MAISVWMRLAETCYTRGIYDRRIRLKKVLVGKSERNILLGRPMRRWENIIKMEPKAVLYGRKLK